MNEIDYITESRTHDIMVEYRCTCWSKGAVDASGWSLDMIEVKARTNFKKSKKTKSESFLFTSVFLSFQKLRRRLTSMKNFFKIVKNWKV